MLKYLLVTSGGLESGVIKKAIAQVSGFNSLGLKSELIIISDQLVPDLSRLYPFIKIIPLKTLRRKDIFNRLLRAVSIRRSIRDVILSLDRKDLLYHRGLEFQLSYYPLAFFRTGRRCKIVSEHQSIEIRQSILYGSYLSALKDLLTGGFITGQTDGIIGVTDEITTYWSGRLFCGKIPHTTIANGFDVGSVPVRTPPAGNRADIHLLFVGNVSRWHGLDRIVQGIAAYRGKAPIILHIVGEGDELQNLQNLAKTVAPEAQIHYHGKRIGQQMDSFFNECDIAIGSLGLHRQGLSQASSLKVREYCSRGIPFMMANQDPDFPESFSYCLRASPIEEPIAMEDVVAFVNEMRKNPRHPERMRAFAEDTIDWKSKIKKTYEFITAL